MSCFYHIGCLGRQGIKEHQEYHGLLWGQCVKLPHAWVGVAPKPVSCVFYLQAAACRKRAGWDLPSSQEWETEAQSVSVTYQRQIQPASEKHTSGAGTLGARLCTWNLPLSLDRAPSIAHNKCSLKALAVGIFLSTLSLAAFISSSTRSVVRLTVWRSWQSVLIKGVCTTSMACTHAVCLSFCTPFEWLTKMRFSEMSSFQINNQGLGLDLTCKLWRNGKVPPVKQARWRPVEVSGPRGKGPGAILFHQSTFALGDFRSSVCSFLTHPIRCV